MYQASTHQAFVRGAMYCLAALLVVVIHPLTTWIMLHITDDPRPPTTLSPPFTYRAETYVMLDQQCFARVADNVTSYYAAIPPNQCDYVHREHLHPVCVSSEVYETCARNNAITMWFMFWLFVFIAWIEMPKRVVQREAATNTGAESHQL